VAAGRYELLGEIAHGGMGVVYRATDTVLRREVAVKVLQQRLAPTALASRRFIDEARISGQLQHPGIPAIHDLGTLADGRPFLVMKLIKGRTLAELLKERGPDSPNFLAVFEQVCHAVGYAHAHGVIHRDLKPANVMVGAHGEVQVMDWGLAKVLASGQRERSPSDPNATTSTLTEIESQREDSDATQTGSVLGTRAYMPPEQAIGAIDQLDARSDVFGLGAVLCAILTGKPPYVGTDTEAVRQQAARGQLGDAQARLAACGAEPELVALCQRCLSVEKTDRPANAGEIAQAVAVLRAAAEARARQAEMEQARAEAEAREQRKRRVVQLALAVVLVLLLAGGGTVAWYVDQQGTQQRLEAEDRDRVEKARQQRNDEALVDLLGRCADALQKNDAAGADAALKQAERRLREGGGEGLRARAERCKAELAVLRELDAIDTFRWTPLKIHLPDGNALAARWQAALAGAGLAPGQAPAAQMAARVAESSLRERLLAVLDLWLLFDAAAPVRGVLSAADPDPYREGMRAAVAARDTKRLAELAGRPEALAQPPWFAAVLGQNRAVPVEQRRAVLQAALRPRPGDLALLMALGDSYPINQRAGADERARWLQAAVTAHPLSGVAHDCLGIALLDQGDVTGAISAFQESLRLDPKDSFTHNNLGNALCIKGDLDGAIKACKEALRLDPKNYLAFNNLGIALRGKGKWDEAISAYQEALHIHPEYAPAHYNLGNALFDKGDQKGAISAYKDALRHDANFVPATYRLATVLRIQGELDEAIKVYRDALRLDPKNALGHNDLGVALHAKGEVEEAVRAFRESIRLDPQRASSHYNLGTALAKTRDWAGAISAYHEAIRLEPKNAMIHYNLGNAYGGKGSPAESIRAYQDAVRLDPKLVVAHINLGIALRTKGDWAGAISAFQETVRVEPKHAFAYENLGNALRNQDELNGAIRAYREARRLDPKNATAHNNLGRALWDHGDLEGAASSFQEALRLNPRLSLAHDNLRQVEALRQALPRLPDILSGRAKPKTPAEVCLFAELCALPVQKRFAAAARLYAQAFVADARLGDDWQAGHRYRAACCAAWSARGDGVDAPAGPKERAELRAQALAWLRADLALHQKQAASPNPFERRATAERLAHWLSATALAGVRPGKDLLALPRAEQIAWEAVWAEHRAVRAAAEAPSPEKKRP
jgi:tetratricopeptide (TPR) repeat protein/tRNA A-37 threonylcarbamoyl transferase component Bud32